MSYSNLKALIKKELIDMVNKHTTRLRALQANEPNNKVVAAFNAITPYASKDEVDPVDIFILLNKEAQFAAKTVSFGFLGFQKKDDDFVSELKTLIKIILRQDILSETRYYPDKAFKFSAEKMTFIENIFGKNSALDDDDAALKKPEYISFRRANPQFSNLNLSGDDIEFIQRFYSLVELKENFIVQQNQQAQSAAEKEKNDDTTKQALESLSNQMQTMTTQLLTVTSELKNVREDVRKKDEDLAEVYTLMRWIKSQSRIKTILQANGSTEAKKILALPSTDNASTNNGPGFFGSMPGSAANSSTIGLDFGKFILSHYENGQVSKANVYQARFELVSNLMNIVNSIDGTIGEDEKKIFQLAIYSLLRFKYKLTIQDVFSRLENKLSAEKIKLPEELQSNFKVFARQDELKAPIDQELSVEEATMFKKFYTGTKQFPQPILPKDEIALQDFTSLSQHLYKPQTYKYEMPVDIFFKYVESYKNAALQQQAAQSSQDVPADTTTLKK